MTDEHITFYSLTDLHIWFFQGFGLEFSELREYTHGFFSNVAEILDDGFIQVKELSF